MSRVLVLFCGLMLVACSKSSTPGAEDGDISFDAEVPDSGTEDGDIIEDDGGPDEDAEVEARCGDTSIDPGEECDDGNTTPGDGCDENCELEGFCGDSNLDPGESCDDGNTEPGDGCDENCAREAFCGDGNEDPGEVCDDGNNRSGDGCRSDCGSDETCGNGIRDGHIGEACDSTPGCSDMCQLMMCGNDSIDPPETCDDGGTEPFDGCGADCQEEISMILSSLTIAGTGDPGCDFSGDGVADHGFARALGGLTDLLNSMFLENAITDGQLILLLNAVGLDDRTMANDDSFSLGWLTGIDTDDDASNNLTGSGEFFADGGSLDADGNPLASFESSVMSRNLDGGPEDVDFPIAFLPLEIRQSRVTGTTTASGGEVTGIEDGLLCGAVPVVTVAFLPNIIDMFLPGEPAPPCDGSMIDTTLADIVIGGTPRGFIFPLPGVQPDVDLDGDGLERFEVDRTGPRGCQPVVTACIDGDGTRVEGRDCIMGMRFEDGWSASFPIEAVRANIIGVR